MAGQAGAANKLGRRSAVSSARACVAWRDVTVPHTFKSASAREGGGEERCWLLRAPCFKFFTRQLCNVGLAFVITFVPIDGLSWAGGPGKVGGQALLVLLLLSALGGCGSDYIQLAGSGEILKLEMLSVLRKDVPSQFRSDPFNSASPRSR